MGSCAQPGRVAQPTDHCSCVVVAGNVRLIFDPMDGGSTTAVAALGADTLPIVRRVTHSDIGKVTDEMRLGARRTS